MLIEGRPYSEIIAKLKKHIPGLSKANITNHKRHFPVVPEAVKEFQKQLEEGKRKVIDDLEFLEKVKAKADALLDITSDPSDLQKITAAAVQAMKLKYEISGDVNNPVKELLEALYAEDEEETG